MKITKIGVASNAGNAPANWETLVPWKNPPEGKALPVDYEFQGTLLAELIDDGVESDDMRWLKRLLKGPRMVDLHALCFSHHFHPLMAGRTSIKAVLPAVWSEASPIKSLPPYDEFPADTDPYAALKKAGQVAEGCGAMQAYLDVLSGSVEARDIAKAGLLRYNYVDTLAMCLIVDYWTFRLDEQRGGAAATTRISKISQPLK